MTTSPLATLAQQERTRREVLHKSDLIPPLPDVVVRIMSALGKPDTQPAGLETLLRVDQVLVARLLSMVNSPFYGLSRRIGTIRDAIMVLGFRGLRSLVLASSTTKFLARDYGCYGFSGRGLWHHALDVAAGARCLAQRTGCGIELAEQVFVAGLLHDIGKMVLAPYVLKQHAELLPGTDVEAGERGIAGIDHSEAGALVAAKWNLIGLVQDLIRDLHMPTPGEHELPTSIVRLAHELALERRTGMRGGIKVAVSFRPADLDVLGIDDSRFLALKADMAEAMDMALAAMGNIGT